MRTRVPGGWSVVAPMKKLTNESMALCELGFLRAKAPPWTQAQDPLTHLVLGEGGGIREHGQKWIVHVEPERLVHGR